MRTWIADTLARLREREGPGAMGESAHAQPHRYFTPILSAIVLIPANTAPAYLVFTSPEDMNPTH